jgi:hypothetical protein
VYAPERPGPHPLVLLLDGEWWRSVARLDAALMEQGTIARA